MIFKIRNDKMKKEMSNQSVTKSHQVFTYNDICIRSQTSEINSFSDGARGN